MAKPKLDNLFALSTAEPVLETEAVLTSARKAAVVYRPVDAAHFQQVAADTLQMLHLSSADLQVDARDVDDQLGYRWIALADADLSSLVAAVHLIGANFQEAGFGEGLLAALFPFRDSHAGKVYLVYHYKHGVFYPFAPRGETKERDTSREFHLQAILKQALPWEKDLERWYPLWDAPV